MENQQQQAYTRRALELRAAEYYASIRKPKSEWKTIEDLEPQLAEFEHVMLGENYIKAVQVVNAIEGYLYAWCYHYPLIELYNHLSEHLVDPKILFKNFLYLGNVYRRMDMLQQAFSCYEQAMEVAHQNNDLEDECACLNQMGLCYRYQEQNELAITYYQKALILARQLNHSILQARSLSRIASTHKTLGQMQQAIENYLQALAIVNVTRDLKETAGILGGLGQTYHALGQYMQAIETQKHSLQLSEQRNDRLGETMSLDLLGRIYSSLGQIEKAIACHKQTLTIAHELGNLRMKSFAQTWLGWALLRLGDFVEAQKHLKEAAEINVIENEFYAVLGLAITSLYLRLPKTTVEFEAAITHCRNILQKTAAYKPQYALATALIGQAICNPYWTDPPQRTILLAPALAEYHRAIAITSAPGIVHDALRDLELIRAAGIEGLEPAFALLEDALPKNMNTEFPFHIP